MSGFCGSSGRNKQAAQGRKARGGAGATKRILTIKKQDRCEPGVPREFPLVVIFLAKAPGAQRSR
jgi:hypothetical protein